VEATLSLGRARNKNTCSVSSVEAKYGAMATTPWELVWIKLLQELKFCEVKQMKLYCDNQTDLHIASNPVFHEITKHVEIDCHFVREKLLFKKISIEFVSSNDQLVVMLTKIFERTSDPVHMFETWSTQSICSSLRGNVRIIYVASILFYVEKVVLLFVLLFLYCTHLSRGTTCTKLLYVLTICTKLLYVYLKLGV